MTRLVVVLLPVLVLAACTTGSDTPGEGSASAPGTESEATPGTGAEAGPPSPPPPPPPPKPVFDPNVFAGMTGEELEAGYGAPRLKRQEGVAEVWQYLEGDCVLHLFLYADESGEFRVEHAEAQLRREADNPDLTAASACAGPFGVIRDSEPDGAPPSSLVQ